MKGIAYLTERNGLKKDTASLLKRHFVTSVATKAVVLGAGFTVSVLLARLLTPSGVGTLSLVMAVPMIVCSVGNLGIRQAITYYTGKQLATPSELFRALLVLWLGTSLLAVLIAAGCYLALDYETHGWSLLIAALLAIPPTILLSYLEGMAMGAKAIPLINFGRILNVLAYLAMVLILVAVLHLGSTGAVLALITGLTLQATLLFKASSPTDRPVANLRSDLISDLIKRGIPYAVGLLIFQLNYRVDVLLLGHFVERSDIGHYSVGVALTELLWQVPAVLGFLLFSHGASAPDPDRFSQDAWRSASRLTALVALVGLALAALAPTLVPLIYGTAYEPSVQVIWSLLPGVIVAVMFKILVGDLSARGRPMVAAGAFTIALILNIALNLILIPRHGIIGAAVSSSVSYTLGTLVFLFRYRRITRLARVRSQ